MPVSIRNMPCLRTVWVPVSHAYGPGVEAGLYVLLKASEQLVDRWIESVCCCKGH